MKEIMREETTAVLKASQVMGERTVFSSTGRRPLGLSFKQDL